MTLRAVAFQAPLPMEFSRQEYWSGLTYPSLLEIFMTQGSNSGLLQCRQGRYHLSHQGIPPHGNFHWEVNGPFHGQDILSLDLGWVLKKDDAPHSQSMVEWSYLKAGEFSRPSYRPLTLILIFIHSFSGSYKHISAQAKFISVERTESFQTSFPSNLVGAQMQ